MPGSSIHPGVFMKRITLAVAAAGLALAAQAQPMSSQRTYVEAGYTAVSYEESSLGGYVKGTPRVLRGLLGYEVNDNVAIEALAGAGLGYSDGDMTGPSTPGLNVKIESLLGVYVTPKVLLVDNLEGFVRLGYAYGRGKVSSDIGSSTDSENSASYGVGMRYHFDRTTFLNVDYMSYLHTSDFKVKGVTVGIGVKF